MNTTEINVTTTNPSYSREERRIIRKYQRAYKKMITMIVFTIIATITITAVITSNILSRPALVQTDEKVVTVKAYDSLWGFCEETCPEKMDIRTYIDIVVEYNDKDGAEIYVNEVIRLPIFSEVKY